MCLQNQEDQELRETSDVDHSSQLFSIFGDLGIINSIYIQFITTDKAKTSREDGRCQCYAKTKIQRFRKLLLLLIDKAKAK